MRLQIGKVKQQIETLQSQHREAVQSSQSIQARLSQLTADVKEGIQKSFLALIACGQELMVALATSTGQAASKVPSSQALQSSLFNDALNFLETRQELNSHKPLDQLRNEVATACSNLQQAAKKLSSSSPFCKAVLYIGKILQLGLVSFLHCLDSWPAFSALVKSPEFHQQLRPNASALRELHINLEQSAQKLLVTATSASDTDAVAVEAVQALLGIKTSVHAVADCLQLYGAVQCELQAVKEYILQLCITACRHIIIQKHRRHAFADLLPQVGVLMC